MAVATMRVPTIFTAVDRFSSVVSRMSMSASAFGKSAEAAAMRTSRKFNSMGNSMLTTGVAIATGIGYAVNEAAKFEDRIANIGTLIPELNTLELKGVGDKLLEFSKNTSKPIDEITTSFYDLISAGVKLNDAYPLIKSIDDLAITGLGSLTEATDIQLAAMRNFKTSFKDSDDAANVLFKTVKHGVTTVQKLSEAYSANAGYAGLLGVTGQEFSAGIVGLTATKMPTSQAEVALGSISLQIGKTTEKRNKILFSIFKKLGVTKGSDLLKKTGGFLPAITAISNTAKKAGINMQSVFGDKRAGIAFINLSNNIDAINAYTNSLQHLNDKTEDAIGVARKLKEETASYKIGQLKNKMLGLAITIGETLLPKIEDLFNWIGNISTNISAWSEKNSFLVDSLYFVSKWLLIVGIYLKAGAFLFYAMSKAIAIATWVSEAYTAVTELCTVATILAAGAQQTLAGSLMAVAGGLLAAYWPVSVVVGALGLLTYAFWDIGDASENSSTKQIDALMEQNKAYMGSTNVLSTELQKQATLIDNHNSKVLSPKQLVSNIINKEAQRKQEVLSNRDLLKPKEIKPISEGLMSKLNENYKIDQAYGVSTRQLLRKNGLSYGEIMSSKENLAGKSDNEKFFNFIKNSKGELVVNVKVKGGEVESIDDSNAKGLPVKVTSTKTTTKK